MAMCHTVCRTLQEVLPRPGCYSGVPGNSKLRADLASPFADCFPIQDTIHGFPRQACPHNDRGVICITQTPLAPEAPTALLGQSSQFSCCRCFTERWIDDGARKAEYSSVRYQVCPLTTASWLGLNTHTV